MQFKLKNINKIEEATLNLDGLTVISGVNDSGKSTVGKVLFSLVKAISNVGNHNETNQRRKIRTQLLMLYNRLKPIEETQCATKITDASFPANHIDFFNELISLPTPDSLLLLDEKAELINNMEIAPRQKAVLLRYIDRIKELLQESNNPKDIFKNEFQNGIEAEFLNNICSHGTSHSEICFRENPNDEELTICIEKNQIVSSSNFDLSRFPIEDATFVESPLYIHLLDTLCFARTLKEQRTNALNFSPFVNHHVKDMAQKLDAIRYLAQVNGLEKPVETPEINSITGGRFVFDSKSKTIYWEKNGMKYSPVNVASGIKAFGVLEILTATQAINENKILIWDEPENHLHPEWQIKFARLMVEMAKEGIPILISSHSPYFLQGVRYFAEKLDMKNFVNYYLAEDKENGLSVLEDVTADLNRAFIKLAQPMNEIINMGM